LLLAAYAAPRPVGGGSAMPTPVRWLPLEAGPPVFPTSPPIGDVVASYRGTKAVGGDVRPLAPCNSRIQVSPFQGFQPPPPPVAHRLVATMSAPVQVRAGERLRYTITLRNITGEPVTFGSVCPSYFESGRKADQLLAKAGYALNCHPVGAIPTGGTVTFAMELAVLPSAAPGANTFGWELGPDFDADTSARGSIWVAP
jgi:hypothetical protein